MHHLVVLQHGLWGKPKHLGYIQQQLETFDKHDQIIVLNCAENEGTNTYDGIDICGNRVVAAVQAEIKRLQTEDDVTVTKISFIGYSLGGLILRYAVGRLFTLGLFKQVEPISFITLATPHLGSCKHPEFLFNRIYNFMTSFFVYRTGLQLNLVDDYHDKGPLLLIMSDPELSFHKGLKLFKRKICYANTKNDRVVRYTTSSISHSNPYRKFALKSRFEDGKYPSIVSHDASQEPPSWDWRWNELAVFSAFLVLTPALFPLWIAIAMLGLTGTRVYKMLRGYDPKHHSNWFIEHHGDLLDDRGVIDPKAIRKCMIDNLNQLDWEKYDTYFRFTNGHGSIVVRNWAFSKYKDVVQHLIDHLEV